VQDKDNSETVDTEEVCAFAKKLITLAFRTAKNVLPTIAKAITTVMSSEAATQVLCMYIHVHACIHARLHTCMCVCVCVCVHVYATQVLRMYIRACVVCVCVCVCVYVCATQVLCMYLHAYACIHAYHIYMSISV